MKIAQNYNEIFGQIKPPPPVAAMGSGEQGLNTLISRLVELFFLFGAIAFVLYFLWGAVDFIISGGDKEKVGKARAKITYAIIGLILMALSFVIFRVIETITGLKILV
jgi:hypothetical protein